MSILKRSSTALGRLAVVAGLAAAFLFGLAGVVYMSLQGKEVKVPEIVGKDYTASEAELAALGLKIKRRADRFSPDKPNTVLEQLPRPGETVKTGQMILVVVSKSNGETEEAPSTLKKSVEDDDSEKIEKMISDQPKKKSNSNPNANKKKSDKTRDVEDNTNSNSNSNSDSVGDNTEKTNTDKNSPEKNKNSGTSTEKKAVTQPANKKVDIKPVTIEVPRRPTKP